MREDVKILLCVVFGLMCIYSIFYKPKSSNDPMILYIRKNFIKLDPSYESIPIVETKKGTYTENKSVIYLCVRDPRTGKYYDHDVVMYVALHELAHVLTKEEGHTKLFTRNFNRLLSEAQQEGIYHPVIPPQMHC